MTYNEALEILLETIDGYEHDWLEIDTAKIKLQELIKKEGSYMRDYYVGMYLYRITTWEDSPRQEREFTVIKAPYDFGDFEDVIGFDTLEEAIKYIKEEL